MQQCPHCRKSLQEDGFFKNRHRKNGLSILCKDCFKTYEASPDRRAKRTWNTLHARVRLQASYTGVEVRMTRDQFLAWAIPVYTNWQAKNPGLTPSIDRIDPKKHYELGNLRVIERGENARLASNHPNVYAPEGMAWCSSCRTYLPRSLFWASLGAFNGLQKRCKACHTVAMRMSKERSQPQASMR